MEGTTGNKNYTKKRKGTKQHKNRFQRFYKNEMKKIAIIAALIITTAVVLVSCDNKRQPGKIYMPDMTYSRAYETYAARDTAFTMDPAEADHKIFYNGSTIPGTM